MRFLSRLDSFRFREQLHRVTSDFFPDQEVLINLITLNDSINELRTSVCGERMEVSGGNILAGVVRESSISTLVSTPDSIPRGNGIRETEVDRLSIRETEAEDMKTHGLPDINRLRGSFVCENVVNLSKRALSKSEISLLSKGLKFIPTPSSINKARLKLDLEKFGRKLRLKWHFRNNRAEFGTDPFIPKSSFNPRKGGDVAIEIYLSGLEDRLMEIANSFEPSFNNLTREERSALHKLQNDKSIVIKEADKGSSVVVWDREDYLREAESQLNDREVYEEYSGGTDNLLDEIHRVLQHGKDKRQFSNNNIYYLMINNPRVG